MNLSICCLNILIHYIICFHFKLDKTLTGHIWQSDMAISHADHTRKTPLDAERRRGKKRNAVDWVKNLRVFHFDDKGGNAAPN